MRKHLLRCALLACAFAIWSGGLGAQSGAAGQPLSPVNGPIVLFDGKTVTDLSGFDTWVRDTQREDPRKIFNVGMDGEQPVIHITGDGYGGLVTKNAYTNYHLVAEYRWGDRKWGDRANAAKDSGILLHGIGPLGGSTVQKTSPLDGRGGLGLSPWIASLELQIIERGVGDLLVLGGDGPDGKPLDIAATVETVQKGTGPALWYQKGGTPKRIARNADATRVNWGGKDPDPPAGAARGRSDADSPGNGWTRVEAIMDGNKMTYLINGVTVMEGTNVTPTAGKLQFQTEMAEIYFRNLVLNPLK